MDLGGSYKWILEEVTSGSIMIQIHSEWARYVAPIRDCCSVMLHTYV